MAKTTPTLTPNLFQLRGDNIEVNYSTSSIDGKPLLEYKSHQLVFDENMSVGKIAHFMIEVLDDEKGQTDSRMNGEISGLLQKHTKDIEKIVNQLRHTSGPVGAFEKLQTAFHFEKSLKDFPELTRSYHASTLKSSSLREKREPRTNETIIRLQRKITP